MDYTDEACQKQLIKIFVNAVFVYDDKIVLTFNYSGDDRTVTLRRLTPDYSMAFVCPRLVPPVAYSRIRRKVRYNGSGLFLYRRHQHAYARGREA
ncbi:MAG: hypothetical protein ACLUFV_03255 [Acutalibacteraceae bacterium]